MAVGNRPSKPYNVETTFNFQMFIDGIFAKLQIKDNSWVTLRREDDEGKEERWEELKGVGSGNKS